MLKYKYVFQIKYAEAVLSNTTRKLFCFETAKKCQLQFKKVNLLWFCYNFRHALVPCCFPVVSASPHPDTGRGMRASQGSSFAGVLCPARRAPDHRVRRRLRHVSAGQQRELHRRQNPVFPLLLTACTVRTNERSGHGCDRHCDRPWR